MREQLAAAARKAGLEEGEIDATITSGLTAGKPKPELPTIKVVRGEIARAVDEAEAALWHPACPISSRWHAGGTDPDVLPAADNHKVECVLLRRPPSDNLIYLLNQHAAMSSASTPERTIGCGLTRRQALQIACCTRASGSSPRWLAS